MTLFRMQGVSKRYGGVRALQDAQLAVEAGRIHAVLGENGAGKSTLIKIMAGVVAPDEGILLLDGAPVPPRGSEHLGSGPAVLRRAATMPSTCSLRSAP